MEQNRSRHARICESFAGRCLLLILALGSCSAFAQTEGVRPNDLVIPATVTDGSGRAVTGFDRAKFRASINGRSVEMTGFATSRDLAAAIVFAPAVSGRWTSIPETIVKGLRDGGPDEPVTLVLSQKEELREEGRPQDVQLIAPQQRYRTSGRELAEMILLGFDSMAQLPIHVGRRRAVFVVLSSPPETFRRYRRQLLNKAAEGDVQLFALWNARPNYSEYEGRSMKALEELVEQTGGRSAQFRNPEEIPGIVMQFAAALRQSYELHFQISSGASRGKLQDVDVELQLPSSDPQVRVSFRRKFSLIPD